MSENTHPSTILSMSENTEEREFLREIELEKTLVDFVKGVLKKRPRKESLYKYAQRHFAALDKLNKVQWRMPDEFLDEHGNTVFEGVAVRRSRTEEDYNKAIDDAFKSLDMNQDGFLSRDEFDLLINHLAGHSTETGEPFCPTIKKISDFSEKAWTAADALEHQDGKISKAEFKPFMFRVLTGLDALGAKIQTRRKFMEKPFEDAFEYYYDNIDETKQREIEETFKYINKSGHDAEDIFHRSLKRDEMDEALQIDCGLPAEQRKSFLTCFFGDSDSLPWDGHVPGMLCGDAVREYLVEMMMARSYSKALQDRDRDMDDCGVCETAEWLSEEFKKEEPEGLYLTLDQLCKVLRVFAFTPFEMVILTSDFDPSVPMNNHALSIAEILFQMDKQAPELSKFKIRDTPAFRKYKETMK